MNDPTVDGTFTKRVLIVAGALIGVVAIIYFAWMLARVFMVLFGGVLLAVLLSGLAKLLVRHTRLSRGPALGAVVGIIVVLLAGTVFLTGARLSDQANQLSQRLPQAVKQIEEAMSARFEWAGWLLRRAPEPKNILTPGSGSIAGELAGAASIAAGALTNLAIIVVVGLYLSIHPHFYTKGSLYLVPERHRDRAGELLTTIGRALRWWLGGRFASMAVVGLLTVLGLLIAGIPLAFTLGLIAGVLSFVPYIGPIAGAVPALLVAATEAPVKALYVVLIFAVVQFLESYLVTPLIQERAVSIPPALLIASQVAFGILAGILGVLLATPLAVTIIVAVQMLYVEDVLGESVAVLGTSHLND